MQFEYEPDEQPKRKHWWKNPSAGFVEVHGEVVSKCPSGIDLELAAGLLAEGVPWSPIDWRRDYPKRIYVVFEGVVYRATPTVPGRSYHAFPELPERFPRPAKLKEQVLAVAEKQGCVDEVKDWMGW